MRTWVQIIKACLLLAGASFMALAVLWRYGFNPEALFAVKNRIRMWGRPAVPNIRPIPSDRDEIGSATRPPGAT
jgi:cation/acetate symporter